MLARRWFSQNGEDKRLYSVLGHIKHGRYVDIGAYEPEFHSVTKVFYDDGWSGVNVEPNPRAFKMLEEHRQRDTNIRAAVTWRSGDATLYYIEHMGRSSLYEDQAFAARAHGMDPVEIQVPTISLADVMSKVSGDIHFLKIDTEGAEEDVIVSGDWKWHRPWVVLAEARLPRTMGATDTYQSWEPYLVSRGYVFKHYDGLNRYYVAEERLDNIGEIGYNV